MSEDMVRITLKIGETTIEIEGSESYVDRKLQEPGSFDSLITKITGIAKPALAQKKAKDMVVKKERKPKGPSRKEGYDIVKDLVLTGEGDKPSLKEFYSDKSPRVNYDRNAVFCYYLQKIKEIRPIGINHIYTCYKEVNRRVGDLIVSLSETSTKKGWLETSNMSDIRITIRGEGYVEHDLPKVKKAK